MGYSEVAWCSYQITG